MRLNIHIQLFYPVFVVCTRVSLGTMSIDNKFSLSLGEYYAGAVPRVCAVAVEACLVTALFHGIARALKRFGRHVRVASVMPLVSLRPWLAFGAKCVGVALLCVAARWVTQPLLLLSARARIGMIPHEAVASLRGCAAQLIKIARVEGFWSLWRGSGYKFWWKNLLLWSWFGTTCDSF